MATPDISPATAEVGTLSEAVLGRSVLDQPLVKRFNALVPVEIRAAIAAAAFAALVLVPYLGAVGLWDPWETHYGEVAREMIQRNDYVHPYWENAWFFSKPAFTMWMMAAGMQLTGTGIGVAEPDRFEAYNSAAPFVRLFLWLVFAGAGAIAYFALLRPKWKAMPGWAAWLYWPAMLLGSFKLAHVVGAAAFGKSTAASAAGVGHPDALGLYTEWGFRLPFVLSSLLAVGLMTYALSRTVSVRAGLATGFVTVTMPLYFLISRQAVTDTPIINATICAMACAIIGQLDRDTRHRTAWWCGFYVFLSISVLAKELLGFEPAVLLMLYAALMVVPWTAKAWEAHVEWLMTRALTPITAGVVAGAAVYAGVAAVWGGYPNPIGHWVGLMPAIGAFTLTFCILIDRAVANDTQMPELWAQCFKMKLGTGVLLFLLIGVPWYLTMFCFEQVDDEGKLFWFRVLIHDNFSRLGAGVHTTTPGGTFIYFIEQGGYAMFPWVVLLPGAFGVVARLKMRSDDPVDHVGLLGVLWFAFTFALIGASATKFHHYVLPMLPPLALLMGLYLDKLWQEGVARNGMSLILGMPLFLLVGKDLASTPKDFTDLFVYNYDRPYPVELMSAPIAAWQSRPLWLADVMAMAMLGVGLYLFFEGLSSKRSPAFRFLAVLISALGAAAFLTSFFAARTAPMVWFGAALAAAGGYALWESTRHPEQQWLLRLLGALPLAPGLGLLLKGLQVENARGTAAQATMTDALLPLLTDAMSIKEVMGFGFIAAGVLVGCIALSRSKVALYSTSIALVTAWVLWFNWSHWLTLTNMWTQRDQFWRYYQMRKPNEPIASFLMNWRGETFYSRNTVKQIKDNNLLYQFAQQPGREFALVEHARLGILKGAVGPDKVVTLIDKDLNNKFVLVTIE